MLYKSIYTVFFTLLAVVVIAASKYPITIFNSGSTNAAGYTIIIDKDGQARYYIAPRKVQLISPTGIAQQPSWRNGTAKLSHTTLKNLEKQIKKCEPFNKLPVETCAKSTSFGYSLTLTCNKKTTPDLTCTGGNKKLTNLATAVNGVISELKI
jgi:hypothetical protein